MVERQYLGFSERFVEKILAGEKTSTIRVGFDRDVSAGDRVELRTESGEVFGEASVTRVVRRRIKSIVSEGVDGHSQYESVQECVQALSQYYPDTELRGNTVVTVVHFTDVESVAK